MGEPATTVWLAWEGMLAGPDVAGGDNAAGEVAPLAVLGGAHGWWIARRQSRGEPV